MNTVLPNILIDRIPFLLEPKWLTEWNSGGNVLFKAAMHDEGHFFWFLFDRNKRNIITGTRQFDFPDESMVRIVLHTGLFERIDYYRRYHHGGFDLDNPIKKHGYQLLPDAVAAHLVAQLQSRDIKRADPALGNIVQEILAQMPAALKVQERWKKPEAKKKRGPKL